MTREEAIQKAERALNDPIAKGGGVVLLEIDHLRVLLETLRGAQPDPETGLMPCGCGGKAGFHYTVMQRDNDCCVACGTCGVHSRVALCEEEARDAWNRAMGWREDE